jgi:hypothetical protein
MLRYADVGVSVRTAVESRSRGSWRQVVVGSNLGYLGTTLATTSLSDTSKRATLTQYTVLNAWLECNSGPKLGVRDYARNTAERPEPALEQATDLTRSLKMLHCQANSILSGNRSAINPMQKSSINIPALERVLRTGR